MTDDGHHDDGRKRVSTWWYVHLLQLAAIEPRARDRFDMEEEEAASVLRALAQTPVEQCIELRGDQSTWLHDALGNKWGDDWRDGRWMRWDGRRKTYLQWFLAYLRYQRLPESGIVVCHSCGCPWCIRLEHIRYDTKDEDQKDKDFHGAAAANRGKIRPTLLPLRRIELPPLSRPIESEAPLTAALQSASRQALTMLLSEYPRASPARLTALWTHRRAVVPRDANTASLALQWAAPPSPSLSRALTNDTTALALVAPPLFASPAAPAVDPLTPATSTTAMLPVGGSEGADVVEQALALLASEFSRAREAEIFDRWAGVETAECGIWAGAQLIHVLAMDEQGALHAFIKGFQLRKGLKEAYIDELLVRASSRGQDIHVHLIAAFVTACGGRRVRVRLQYDSTAKPWLSKVYARVNISNVWPDAPAPGTVRTKTNSFADVRPDDGYTMLWGEGERVCSACSMPEVQPLAHEVTLSVWRGGYAA